MLIGEAAAKTCLTKKAIEYYAEQGLINPEISENGYRNFSEDDISKLRKISVLRNLGLSVADIKDFFSDNGHGKIQEIINRKAFEAQVFKEKEKLLRGFSEKPDWDKIQEEIENLERKNSILTRF